MKNVKLVAIVSLSSIFLMGMGSFFVSKKAMLDVGSDPMAKQDETSDRKLELGQAEKKTKETGAEARVALNDPAISQAWGFRKSEAANAWKISQGSYDITVAVIDTGADINHEDLDNNIWTNEGETGVVQTAACQALEEKAALAKKECNKAKDGVDNDGNGYIDDVHGWNFVSNNGDLTDNHGHGTHIAGIIGAKAGNSKGIAGISPNVKLMILKYFDPKVPVTDNLKNTINSINYAIANGARIINYSGGGTEFSQEEKDAIEEARKKGILFVAAAGNERSNSDHHKYYPADYGLNNIISVTAIDPKTEVLASSNYGTQTVDLAAPGQNILSTLPGDSYGYMTGTSQATAFVTGAAVLVMAYHPQFIASEVKKYILATGDTTASLIAKTGTGRRLNLYKALTSLDSGVSASGVVLANAPRQRFTAEAAVAGGPLDQTARIATFGKSLMDAIGGAEKPKERLGGVKDQN